MKLTLILNLVFLFAFINGIAQDTKSSASDFSEEYINWQHKDYNNLKVVGVSSTKLYNEVLEKNAATKTIVVAIIDGGVDIYHEDFKDKIWVNENEIPDNNIDDDKNGYVDDINGWNYIGNSEGENINKTTLEITRMYASLSAKYDGKEKQDNAEYKEYLKVKHDYNYKYKQENQTYSNLNQFLSKYILTDSITKAYLKKDTLAYEDVKGAFSVDNRIQTAINYQKNLFENGFTIDGFMGYYTHIKDNIDYYYNTSYNPRLKIIADNLSDINDNKYGNNNVKGPNADHGTMVAGIVAAKRNNNIGINGIAENVKIMALRVVPDGDEYDKDVALSIRYAVDNGAQIINMSFGKNYSPEKEMVWEAMQYAASKNVLMIKAAGNEALDIDKIIHFPTAFMAEAEIESIITVGASGANRKKDMPAIFSNYGYKSVDLFAPGVDIISVYPENKYKMASGTSFASPVVAGVAALIWSCFPELTAKELKSILVDSATDYGKRKVYKPGRGQKKREKIRFKELSHTGAIINVYSAYQLALEKQKGSQK